MRLLRGRLVKCSMPLCFFVEKMGEAFALQKLHTFLIKKYWHILDIKV